ncbi:MAG: DNA polymerase III subunit delta' [Desulfobacterota bacterium]|nr:DNA polymerase III subunit delta' [Thermodesulfobacteriota bacterium]MDW8001829.1 DNA polymerase III subunit delta' [Deltaproteobacteria bacterium]
MKDLKNTESSEIVGHEKQKAMLFGYMENGRLPHALLLSGPFGIGKKRLALCFAKRLMCSSQRGDDNCPSCKWIERGTHPDLLLLGGANKPISVEHVREVIELAENRPYLSETRVIVFDDAHLMSFDALGALLKTLEEPKQFNVFILITSQEEKIPLTIRSRCTRIPFSPIEVSLLKQYLVERRNLDEKKAEIISNVSFGSFALAEFWTDEANIKRRRRLFECVLGVKRSSMDISLISQEISASDCDIYLYSLLGILRDQFVYSMTKDVDRLYNKDSVDLLRDRLDGQRLREKMEMVIYTMRALKNNVNRWLAFENLIYSLCEEE